MDRQGESNSESGGLEKRGSRKVGLGVEEPAYVWGDILFFRTLSFCFDGEVFSKQFDRFCNYLIR